MSPLTFLFRTDVHAADKSPESWKADYPSEVWSNLEQIGEIARQCGAVAVLDGGDFFHVKAATRNSHALVARAAEIHLGYPCPIYSIEGNHDISYNNVETVERQPYGVLLASGVFKSLRDQVFEAPDLRVRVVGLPFSPFRKLEELRTIKKQPGDTHLIVVLHALAGENPPDHVEDFFGEPVFRYRDLIFEDGPDVVCFGHWHKDQGITEIDGRFFINQGAVSRGALVRDNLTRTPKVAIIQILPTGVEVQSVLLKVAPAEDVFDLERKERQEKESTIIEQFVDRIKSDAKLDPAANIEDSVATLDFAPEIRDLALEYLERARSTT
jgi:DNA repair exonuclease SbcCD nuclease subunit